MKYNTVIVSFSARKNGNCEQIAEYIRTTAEMQTNVSIYKFSDFQISSCGYCEYECFHVEAVCPHIDDMEYELLEKICSSDYVYFVVPNYCDHPCANFYLFNERSLCYFQNRPERLEQYLSVQKKFIVVSGSEAASFITAFEQHTDGEPRILYLSAKNYGKQSIQGNIMEAPAAKADLAAFLSI